MCGIVGYVGKEEKAVPVLINGLSKLEYRGYDSAGIAVIENGRLRVEKKKGRLAVLEDLLKKKPLKSHLGIGHTRWATHGEPSDVNSHPHVSQSGKIAVVHNGIIENYIALRKFLEDKGFTFASQTDTEVVAHLLDYFYKGDMFEAIQKMLGKIEGAYALGIVCDDCPDTLYAVRKDSPLIVGLGKEENFIASDIPAILEYTRKIYFLNDNEIVVLKENDVKIYDKEGKETKKKAFNVEWDVNAAEKAGYDHFMLKEIMEQPRGVKETLHPRIKDGLPSLESKLTKEDLKDIEKIYIVACGTAAHAGMVGKTVIEKLAKIPVEVEVASEFRYRDPIISEKNLVIIISQSGETADTLAALRLAKEKKAKILSIVNVVGSSIARESNDVIYTWAGPEIAVASTKAFTTQLAVIYLMAIDLALKLGKITKDYAKELITELNEIPDKIEKLLESREKVCDVAKKYYQEHDIYFLGRGTDYSISLEGSLKLKEISYIHSDAYPAGELKHGPIALIDKGTLVIAIATQPHLLEKMISNIKEVKARGAIVFGVSEEGSDGLKDVSDFDIYIPKVNPMFSAILSVIPLQLFAYYCAVTKGCDVDKPRNLAKSVTVE